MAEAVTLRQAAALLVIENLEVIYNRAVTAVQGVSIGVVEGSITALVGTNGAGKSTTLAAIAGFMRADDVQVPNGTITFAGEQLRGLRNYQISGRGIGLVPERNKIFPTMSVAQNLAACRPADEGSAKRALSLEEIVALFPRLKERYGSIAGYLSGGERQMLAIGMALLTGPRLLLIDEMSLGLAPIVVSQLQDTVRQLRDRWGVTFLVVEQSAATALEVADYLYVMENGRVVFDGTPERLRQHGDFREFYLGMGEGGQRSYSDVKQYRRKRRWFG
jgi:branched-chain amino acid transport system ATP-binding protein